ncbi:MAG TPA: phosphohistidine phosphatase SixA [Candidatus Binataceae bacterium]|nr:phosphohistidine phosphatase SixA [Candidatus Binataceae bacterium]
MKLYILRHGIAEDAAPGGDDGARKLTARGREKLRDGAERMRALGLKFNVILTSPLARATETAEVVAAAYANDPPPQVLPALATGVAPQEAITALRAFAKHRHVMIVGHEPQLSAIASMLLTAAPGAVNISLKKGGLISLEVPARPDRGSAQLRWMLTARQLRKLRK